MNQRKKVRIPRFSLLIALGAIMYVAFCIYNSPEIQYKPRVEGIKLRTFLNDSAAYTCIGTSFINRQVVSTKFRLSNGYSVLLLRLGKASNTKYSVSKGSKKSGSGFYMGENGPWYDIGYFYDKELPTIKKLNLNISDGDILSPGYSDKKIKVYNAFFRTFEITYNDGTPGIRGESSSAVSEKGQGANFAFYKYKNEIYLIMLTSKTRFVEKDKIIQMLKK